MNARKLVALFLMLACFSLPACTITPGQCLPVTARSQHVAPKSGNGELCSPPSTAAASTVIHESGKKTVVLARLQSAAEQAALQYRMHEWYGDVPQALLDSAAGQAAHEYRMRERYGETP